jgi:uncharacterized protein (DUF362 family)
MSDTMNRREVLFRGLGTVAALAGGNYSLTFGAEQKPSVPPLPDRSKDAPSMPVAIQRCKSYEPGLVRRKLDTALRLIGGLDKLVRGKTVTVKLNMTGDIRQVGGLPASRTYQIHPSVVTALCAILDDAGARRIVLVEALYYREPVEEILKLAGWDLAALQSAAGHKVVLENAKNRGIWPKYSRLKVPWGGYLFPAFDVNQWYDKTDVFVSLAKLKEHSGAGVTMASKNLFGILPTALYGNDAPNEDTVKARTALLHMGRRTVPDGVPGEIYRGVPRDDWSRRIPRVVADVVCARPVDLCVIDGIDTVRGGEGYWNKGVEPIQPKLLLVGKNCVCTDAVCTAVMGHDPMAAHNQPPFQGENHLQLLAAAGIGMRDIGKIEVRGVSLKQAIHPFTRKTAQVAMNTRTEGTS